MKTSEGHCEHRNKPSGSIKGEEFLDDQSDYKIFKDSAHGVS